MRCKGAPAFLFDIAPAGAAKRFLMARLDAEKPDNIGIDLFLLGRSTPAPIGNLRIKESVETLDARYVMGFSRQDVVIRDNRFLEYAYERGAAIGGATGAGGEAPKLLMTEDANGLLYPDAVLLVCEVCAQQSESDRSGHFAQRVSLLPRLADVGYRDRADAEQLRALPDILTASGLPDVTMNHPLIPLRNLDQRLSDWGLK